MKLLARTILNFQTHNGPRKVPKTGGWLASCVEKTSDATANRVPK